MKIQLLLITILTLVFNTSQAQTTVYAKNSDISDNLDLRAVASIFGEATNLQDFERRLNEPRYQISNLDLNNDNEVDYLRVIESVESRTHVIIIQAILDRDIFQDIATIDVERDNYNNINVQVVGNTYLYGTNYIYEPVYYATPIIYTSFWVTNYRPYYSSWRWNYYPTYYYAWSPYPVYRYRNNVNVCINVNNNYNYVNYRRSYRASALYETRRAYGYEKMRPNNGFSQRHANIGNRYELDQRRMASRESNQKHNAYTNANRSTSRSFLTNKNKNYEPNGSYNSNRIAADRNNAARMNNAARIENSSKNQSRRTADGYTSNLPRQNSENRMSTNRVSPAQRTGTSRHYSENRSNSANQNNISRAQNTQRASTQRIGQEPRSNQGSRENNTISRGSGRRI